jgi:hypothetical protein
MKVLGTLVLFFFACFTYCIMKTKQREMDIMLKEILIKGGLMVTALLIAETILEVLENESLKQNEETEVELENEEGKVTMEDVLNDADDLINRMDKVK